MAKIREGYKETEIGVIPEDWEVSSLGNLTRFQGGYAFKSEDFVEEGVKLVKIANVQQYNLLWDDINYLPLEFLAKNAEYSLLVNDVVVAMTRPIISSGIKVCRITEIDLPCLLNQRVGRFLIKDGLSSDFLYQICFTKAFIDDVKNLSNTTGQPNISSKQIESIKISVPPLLEQQRIAEILSTTDAHIEKLDKIIEEYQLLKKGMMKKLLTEGIGHTEFKETEKGPLPTNWNIIEFVKCVSIANGQVDPKKEPYSDMIHIGPGNIEKFTGKLLDFRTAKEDSQISGKYLFDEDDILYGKINPQLGKVAFPKFKGICSADMYPMKANKDYLLPNFLYYLLLNKDFFDYSVSVSKRTGMPKINREELQKYSFVVPTIEEQMLIAGILESIDFRLRQFDEEREDFNQLKKSLMEKLLTGKVRVV